MFLSQKSPIFPHFHDSPPKNRGLFRESIITNRLLSNTAGNPHSVVSVIVPKMTVLAKYFLDNLYVKYDVM